MKFKIGDRVAVYDRGKKHVGNVSATFEDTVEVEIVLKVLGARIWFHEKQCRRLVKKRRMECWVNWYCATGIEGQKVHLTREEALADGDACFARQILFRQVIEKTKGEKE